MIQVWRGSDKLLWVKLGQSRVLLYNSASREAYSCVFRGHGCSTGRFGQFLCYLLNQPCWQADLKDFLQRRAALLDRTNSHTWHSATFCKPNLDWFTQVPASSSNLPIPEAHPKHWDGSSFPFCSMKPHSLLFVVFFPPLLSAESRPYMLAHPFV